MNILEWSLVDIETKEIVLQGDTLIPIEEYRSIISQEYMVCRKIHMECQLPDGTYQVIFPKVYYNPKNIVTLKIS